MELTLTRHDTLQEFHCDRCVKTKKSKLVGTMTENGATTTICNGCYGNLKAKG